LEKITRENSILREMMKQKEENLRRGKKKKKEEEGVFWRYLSRARSVIP